MISKRLMFFAILLISLLAISGVSASEINDDIGINDNNSVADIGEIDDNNLQSIDYKLDDDNANEESNNDGNGNNLISSSESDILTENNPDGTFTDLANEIESADRELNLTRNYVYTSSDSNYQNFIDVTKTLTINGNGFSIDWNNQSCFLNITSSNVIIKNISFKNANGRESAIYWCGSNGTLFNCSFMNNNCSLSGGAIEWCSANSSLFNCTFMNNTGKYGAVYWHASGSLFNCSFINNPGSWKGGAIFSSTAGSFFNCSFVNNSVEYRGGAIYFEGQNGQVYNCSFVNNTATNNGGAVYWYGYNGSLLNCNFENNTATNNGSAIYWYGSGGSLLNCSFVNNTATNSGGAIYWYGSGGSLLNCSFVNNTATNSGGAIYWAGGAGSLIDSIFVTEYDLICWNAKKGTLYNCTFNNNMSNCIDFVNVLGDENKLDAPVNIIAPDILFNESQKGGVTYLGYTENISVYIYNTSNNSTIYNISKNSSSIEFLLDILPRGIYNISVLCSENQVYGPKEVSAIFGVFGPNPSINVTYEENVIAGDNLTLNITLNDDSLGEISLFINNETYYSEIVNGKSTILIPNIIGGNINYILNYSGDSYYNHTLLEGLINIEFKQSFINFQVNDSYYSQNISLIPITPSNATGVISILLNGEYKDNFTVGQTYILSDLNAGEYELTLRYEGDDYFVNCENTTLFTINKINATIYLSDKNYTAGYNFININLNNQSTGNITISVNNKNYTKTLNHGKATVYVDLIGGNNNYTIFYEGDNNFNPTTYKNYLYAQYKQSYINISSKNIYVSNIANVTYNLTNKASGNLSVYLNNDFLKTVLVNESILIEELPAGNHTVRIVYNGDEYYSSCENITTFEVFKYTPTIEVIASNITAGDNANIIFQLNNDITGSIVVNGSVLDLINGRAILNIPNIKGGNQIFNWSYDGDSKYAPRNSSSIVKVAFKKTIIDFILNDINWGDDLTFTPTITNISTGLLDIYVDGNYNCTINIGTTVKIPFFVGGSHSIKVSYMGDDYYASNSTTKKFNVTKINSTCDMVDTIEARNSSVQIYFSERATGNVVIKLNNSQVSSKVVDGICTFNASTFRPGVYDVVIDYKGDSSYNPFTINKTLNIIPKKPTIDLNISNIIYGENIILKPLIASATGNLKVYIDNILVNTISIGSSYTLTKPNVGHHDVKISYDGDNYFESGELITGFWVFNKYPIVSADALIIKGSGNHFNATFYDELGNRLINKYVIFKVNGVDYPVLTDYNGVAYLNNDLDLGNYTIEIISPSVNEQKTNNLLIYTSILANDASAYYGNAVSYSAKFFDKNAKILSNNYVLFKVNGEEIPVLTDDEGNANLNLSLNSGTYDIVSINIVTGENKTNKLIVNPTILSNDKNVNYNSNYFQATFLDKNGDLLVNQEMIFKIGSQEYNRTTNSYGVAILDVVLSPGNYNITSINLVTGETKENKFIVNKLSTNISSSAVSVVYNTGKYLIVTLKDSKGNILSNKKVTINVGTISKTLYTNAKGQVSVLVSSLVPKTYTASISFAGDTIYLKSSTTAKVVVKKATPKLTAKAKTFKRSVKTKKYTITLKNNKGVVMKNTKVTLTVNKKTYSIKTNSKGVATFKITNLKKKGKFTAVVKYAGSKYYNKVTKKPRITIKA